MIINKLDNVEVNPEDGHKYALRNIYRGENVIKYGSPIGHATVDIKRGEHVHTHNMETNLSGILTYGFEGDFSPIDRIPSDRTFMALSLLFLQAVKIA